MKLGVQYKYVNCTVDKIKNAVVAVINYITNYVTSILLIMF